MSFRCCKFTYDDVSCENFGLIVYDVDGGGNDAGKFATGVSIVEEKVASRWKPFFYGTKIEGKLSFQLTFGINVERLDNGEYLSRSELEAIASWLTGKDSYRWLYIEQEDLSQIGYKCLVTSLDIIENGSYPFAFRASFECDGPYAYLPEQVFEFSVNGTKNVQIMNGSSHNGFYMPELEITFSGTGKRNMSIQNNSDDARIFSLTDMPNAVTSVDVDNEHQVLHIDGESLNPYQYFNFKFFRLVNGLNELTLTGKGSVKIICRFPVNVGS